MFYSTNKFHVAVRVFSNRTQMTSKCDENKEVAASVSLMFLPHFDILRDLLLNKPTATWNVLLRRTSNQRFRDPQECIKVDIFGTRLGTHSL